MMLATALLLAVASPIAVDVAGMEPQIEIIRRDAGDRRWQITCEGHAGEETVLRLKFPPNISEEAIRTYFETEQYVGSSTLFYDNERLPPERCDNKPVTSSASSPARVLSFGPREPLMRLAELARACGFKQAVVRERERDDLPAGAVQIKGDWMTLDAGEDITSRYGPTVCFIKMRNKRSSLRPRGKERNGS